MIETPDLFTSYPHVPFIKGSDTSRDAANAIETHLSELQSKVYERIADTSRDAANAIETHLSELQSKVYERIADRGSLGLTDEELQAFTGLSPNTARPRRRELELKGLIKKSGETRPTRSKRQAVVWVIA